MGNCKSKYDKNEETNVKHVPLLSQLNLNETRYVSLNLKAKIY